ncbi:related to Transcription factor IWS1 [Zygosaccharomyces bailii ISA1307]|uniref:ZYBA0S08-03642g1_1 n=1 Tax=Zygosaccharomyces bailii (strain CLIB 213 / ATCC 58445 / CBS 680 / BCRC 21525 / NBRC 1098 / NCYC 1416 / NRRL Y-2227) TaxID=1333698 RepID=A0A8J2TAC1_ZYGB2|nr:ZYBA0S08-03642g1_1 [Zygosaccharomyces bailii CLIB 213]CDH08994.1 related to Transcription factor IWS1 [Zygosaccharomyces bailii ISA1307]
MSSEETPQVEVSMESQVIQEPQETYDQSVSQEVQPLPSDTTAEAERQRKHIEKNISDDDSDSEDRAAQMATVSIPQNDEEVEIDSTHRNRQELEEKLDKIIKRPKARRSRRDEEDLEQFLDEKILRLKDEMNVAAQIDIDTLNKRLETGDNSLIAMQKVRLLPKVESALSKAHLADTILDNNLLQSVRIWLEPLPDGSLPSFEIQKSLFAALEKLPIKTEHLKESGLGRVIIFYTKSKRVEPPLARQADRMIAEWTRPIIGASDNYRDKRIMQLEFDAEKMRRKSALDSAKSRKKRPGKRASEKGSSAQSLYEQAAARRNRAAAPAPTTTDYKYAPTSNLNPTTGPARIAGVGSSLNNSEMFKRLTSRLQKGKRSK